MNLRHSLLVVSSLAAIVVLSGCSASASVGDTGTDDSTGTEETVEETTAESITSAEFAQNISDYFEQQNGLASDIDCGEDDILLEEAAQISCLGIDPTTGDEVPLYITLSNVDGVSYDFDVSQ